MEFLPSLLNKNNNQRKLEERVAVNNGTTRNIGIGSSSP